MHLSDPHRSAGSLTLFMTHSFFINFAESLLYQHEEQTPLYLPLDPAGRRHYNLSAFVVGFDIIQAWTRSILSAHEGSKSGNYHPYLSLYFSFTFPRLRLNHDLEFVSVLVMVSFFRLVCYPCWKSFIHLPNQWFPASQPL